MDKESDLMNQEPDEIREQIEDTRSALTAKLETLEQGVKETVHDAKAAVTGTIENVKETVKGTVDTVKDSLDIRSYVQQYPWPMLAGSVGFGFALGCLFRRSTNGDRIAHMSSNGKPLEAKNRFESYEEKALAAENLRRLDWASWVTGSSLAPWANFAKHSRASFVPMFQAFLQHNHGEVLILQSAQGLLDGLGFDEAVLPARQDRAQFEQAGRLVHEQDVRQRT
jgi:ElaB/YqjD/DUF883 family membrane-anchored ribosome-binding protein